MENSPENIKEVTADQNSKVVHLNISIRKIIIYLAKGVDETGIGCSSASFVVLREMV